MLIFQRSCKAKRRLLCCAQQCLHFKSEGETLVKKCWDPQIPQVVGAVAAPRVTLRFVTGKLLWDGAPVALTLCPVVISPSTIFFPQLFLAWPRSDPHTPPAGAPRRAWPRDTRQSRATMRFDASFGRPSPFPSSVPPLPITADTSTRRTDRKPPPGTIYTPPRPRPATTRKQFLWALPAAPGGRGATGPEPCCCPRGRHSMRGLPSPPPSRPPAPPLPAPRRCTPAGMWPRLRPGAARWVAGEPRPCVAGPREREGSAPLLPRGHTAGTCLLGMGLLHCQSCSWGAAAVSAHTLQLCWAAQNAAIGVLF